MLKGNVLFVLLDAFRGDYINEVDTPFLARMRSAGVFASKLKSTAGFTQRSAIYTGMSGAETGMFTMYTFDAENSPFRFLRGNPQFERLASRNALWDRLPTWPGMWRFRKLWKGPLMRREAVLDEERREMRRWIVEESRRHASSAPLLHIPWHILPELGVSEDNRPIQQPGAFEQESIFDVFTANGVPHKYLMYPVVVCQDETVLAEFLKSSDAGPAVILGQYSDSDLLVHQCGPSSAERRKIVGEIDRKLREMASVYDDATTWIIIGDHGMTDVTEEINIPALVRPLEEKHGVTMGEDYVVFLDSTMARFRWKTPAGERFLSELEAIPLLREKGRFVDANLAGEHSIPVGDRRYGDSIWWANTGVLVFPDYFHDLETHNIGMHGYDSNHTDMKGFFLAFGPQIKPRYLDEANLIDVCPTICAAAGVPAPRHSKGACLLEIK